MKDKILIMIIGILLGAILTTLGFYIFIRMSNTRRMINIPNFDERQMMDMPNGDFKIPNGENMKPLDAKR